MGYTESVAKTTKWLIASRFSVSDEQWFRSDAAEGMRRVEGDLYEQVCDWLVYVDILRILRLFLIALRRAFASPSVLKRTS